MLHSWPPCGINQHYQFSTRDNSWRPHTVSSFHGTMSRHYPTSNAWNWCFRYLPDQDIIAALQHMRGHGRNDFPVATMWRALLAGVVFQHESIESLLRELRRNPALLTLCEFDPIPLQSPPKKVLERVDDVLRVNFINQPLRSTIPDSHNFSRFSETGAEDGAETRFDRRHDTDIT